MRFTKIQTAVFLGTLISTLLIFYFFNSFRQQSKNNFHAQFYTQGYNFRKLQSGDEIFGKYKAGEKIDLTKLQTSDKNSLLNITKENLILFVVIDPECPFCKLSKDIMGKTKQTANQSSIAYYPVLFTSIPPRTNLKSYAQSLGFDDSFKWENETKPPQNLVSMPTPAHILVDRNGTILQVWFSSDRDEDVRERMGNQISSDLLLIKEVVETISISH